MLDLTIKHRELFSNFTYDFWLRIRYADALIDLDSAESAMSALNESSDRLKCHESLLDNSLRDLVITGNSQKNDILVQKMKLNINSEWCLWMHSPNWKHSAALQYCRNKLLTRHSPALIDEAFALLKIEKRLNDTHLREIYQFLLAQYKTKSKSNNQ